MIIFTQLLSQVAFAGSDPYVLPITRKETTHKMVAAPWWSGEYPTPMLEVMSKEKDSKTVTIQGHASLRKLTDPQKACTIDTGVYHPWGKGHNVETFYSIMPWVQYEILKDVPEEGLKTGDILDNEIYAAEGYCNYVHVSGSTKKEVQLWCGGELDTSIYKKIDHPAHAGEQWLYLNCKEGYKVFVQDSELSKQTGDVTAKMCGYGTVVRRAEECPADPNLE